MNQFPDVPPEDLIHELEYQHYLPTTLARIATGVECEINSISTDLADSDYADVPASFNVINKNRLTLAALSASFAKITSAYLEVKRSATVVSPGVACACTTITSRREL